MAGRKGAGHNPWRLLNLPMIDPKPHPSRLLRLVAGAARWSLGLLIAFWLLMAAAWGVLHGFIVPRIGDYRPQLEKLAAGALGIPVRIGGLTAHPDGLIPALELSDVALLGPQGDEALRLPKLSLAISVRSLLRLGVEQLYIDAPELDVRRLPDGQWQIAGLRSETDDEDHRAAHWVLDQPEIAIRHGRVHWTDEKLQRATQTLQDVDLVLRRHGRQHLLRLDASPSEEPAERLSVQGEFREALLPSDRAMWERWTGQWYATAAMQQLPPMPWPQDWPVQQVQGAGVVRAWLDVRRGEIVGGAADLDLRQASVVWRSDAVPLGLQQVQGRIEVGRQPSGWTLAARNLAFVLDDGQQWPASDLRLSTQAIQSGPRGAQGQDYGLDASYLDLGLLHALTQRLPWAAPLAQALAHWQPQGQVQALRAHWQSAGQGGMPATYQAKGRVRGLAVAEQADTEHPQHVGRPGVQGLNLAFDLDQRGGTAQVDMAQGALVFPGVFEDARIPVDALAARVRWEHQAEQWAVHVTDASFANTDAAGTLQAHWKTGAKGRPHLPGVLDLSGVLQRANGARVHRYLPLTIPQDARHYVRDSVKAGDAAGVSFVVRGDLDHVPFSAPNSGVFRIIAPLRNVVYDYVPRSLQGPQDKPWPGLAQLSGDLVFDRASMQVRHGKAVFPGGVRMQSIQAQIADLEHPDVRVQAQGQGPLQALLDVVRTSPLSGMTDQALDRSQAQGQARLDLELNLPIDHMDRSKVRGQVQFAGNQFQFSPDVPVLRQTQGSVAFHDAGFELKDVRAQSLGGAVRLSGGMQLRPGESAATASVQVRAQGTATAEGLREADMLGVVAPLARHAQGQAAYNVNVAVRAGQPEVEVTSSLQGLALDLPAPLGKAAADTARLVVRQKAGEDRSQELLQVEVQGRGSVSYVRDTASEGAPVRRGLIHIGSEAAPALPARGVLAAVDLPTLDLDAWMDLMPSDGLGSSAGNATATSFWPTQLRLQTQQLTLNRRALNAVTATASREQDVWRGRIEAQQLAGTVEYQLPGVRHPSGQVSARLGHLSLPESAAQHPGPLLESPVQELPALDIVVDRFELAGRPLGMLEIAARNSHTPRGLQWTLSKFNLTVPEARFKASGTWAPVAAGTAAAPRRTGLQFRLELDDAGRLLERFAMPGVIRRGKGLLEGEIGWSGAPMAPDYRSMAGQVHVDVTGGQFLKADPGLAKLLSVLSLQSLPRRMVLDFRDVFSEGFAFDFIRGDVAVQQGVARTNNLQMKGVNAAVLMEGQAHLEHETQDVRVVVVPEINAMTASLVATAINPVIGLGSFLAQAFLRGPLMAAATKEFRIHGSWSDAKVEAVPYRRPSSDNTGVRSEAPTKEAGPNQGETP